MYFFVNVIISYFEGKYAKKSLNLRYKYEYMSEINTIMKDTAASDSNLNVQPSVKEDSKTDVAAVSVMKSSGLESADSVRADSVRQTKQITKSETESPKSEVTLQMAIDAATQNFEADVHRVRERSKTPLNVQKEDAKPAHELASENSGAVLQDSLQSGLLLENSPLQSNVVKEQEALSFDSWSKGCFAQSKFDSVCNQISSLGKKNVQHECLEAAGKACAESQAVAEEQMVISVPQKDGIERHEALYSQVWFVPMMFVLFFLLGLMVSNQKKDLAAELKDLFRLNRFNLAASSSKASFSRFLLSLLSLFSLSLFVYLAYTEFFGVKSESHFLALAVTFGLVSSFFLFKDLMSALLGYVFFSREHTLVWIRSYTYILALLGLALFPVNLCMSFASAAVVSVAVWIGLFMVLISALLFLYKLNMLFFSGAFSIFYLILYLCTLEILPVSALVFGVGNLIEKV